MCSAIHVLFLALLLPQVSEKDQTVTRVALSDDGKSLVTGHEDGAVRLWDFASGKEIRHFNGLTTAVGSLAVSRDGKRVAAAGTSGACVWDVNSGKQDQFFIGAQNKQFFCVDLSADGNLWLVTDGKEPVASVWDLRTGKKMAAFQGHQRPINLLRFSADGKRAATVCRDGMVVWETATGRELWVNKLPDGISGLQFSGNGQWLAVSTGGWVDRGTAAVRLLEASTGKEVAVSRCAEFSIWGLAFARDDKTLMCGGVDDGVHCLEVPTLKETRTFRGLKQIASISLSRDGKWMATNMGGLLSKGDFTAWIWDLEKGKAVRKIGPPR